MWMDDARPVGGGRMLALWLLGLALALQGCGSGIDVPAVGEGDADADGAPTDVLPDAEPGDEDDAGPGPDDVGEEVGGDDADAAPEDAEDDADVDEGCAEGTPCTDFDDCTIDDACDADGVCVGQPMPCDDGLDCTEDSCENGDCVADLALGFCLAQEPEPTCVPHGVTHPANPCGFCAAIPPNPDFVPTAQGEPCDDGSICTSDETCQNGACVAGTTMDCGEDPAECVAAVCDPVEGCVEVETEDPCDDGDVCTVGDTCSGGACQAGAEPLDCDDGDPCTLDVCDAVTGCDSTGDFCDDGEPCTADSCDDGECNHASLSGACDDGDACTAGESCSAGVCSGGAPLVCEDDNPCTADLCDPDVGCVLQLLTGPCDDGFDCTTDDTCIVGQCLGNQDHCDSCEPPSTQHAAKLTLYELGVDGEPGSGMDVDGDPSTCQPAGDCSGGVDNALAILATVINEPLAASVESGVTILALDLSEATFDGAAFEMPLWDAELTDGSAASGCDVQEEPCLYYPVDTSFAPDCTPHVSFPNARLSTGKLDAGGPGTVANLVFDVSGDSRFSLSLANAQLRAIYTMDASGQYIDTMFGVIGGAVLKQQILDGIAGVSAGDLPIDKQAALELLEQLIVEDVDLDGDGTADAASAGIRFETIRGKLSPKN